MTLQEQIAELPDDCEMFRQVTDLDPLAVVPVGFTSQELKALINELTEKVERYERMMAWAESVDGCDPETAICRDVDADNGTWQILDPLDRFIHERFDTALEAFESLSK